MQGVIQRLLNSLLTLEHTLPFRVVAYLITETCHDHSHHRRQRLYRPPCLRSVKPSSRHPGGIAPAGQPAPRPAPASPCPGRAGRASAGGAGGSGFARPGLAGGSACPTGHHSSGRPLCLATGSGDRPAHQCGRQPGGGRAGPPPWQPPGVYQWLHAGKPCASSAAGHHRRRSGPGGLAAGLSPGGRL